MIKAVLVLILFCLIAEFVARVEYQTPWYFNLLGEKETIVEPTLNSYGLRGPDHRQRKTSDQLRVLVIGDSVTYGWGVQDDQKVFPALLEAKLNEDRGPSGLHKFAVLNAGLDGGLTGPWISTWERLAEPFDPDLVLIIFSLRNGSAIGTTAAFFDQIRLSIVQKNQNSFIYKHFYLYRRFRDVRDKLVIRKKYVEELNRAYLRQTEDTQWERAKRHLRDLAEKARARGSKVGVAVFPALVDLDSSYPFLQITKLIMNFLKSEDIAAVDLREAFLGKSAPDLWVSPYNQHPNETAHIIAAEALKHFVVTLLSTDAVQSNQ